MAPETSRPRRLRRRAGPPCGFVARHRAALLRQARAWTENEADAEDLVQEACARALADLARRDELPSSPAVWLHVILRNTWLNTLRDRRTHAAATLRLPEDPADRTLVDARVTHAQFVRLWGHLPRNAQRVVLARLGDEEALHAARFSTTRGAVEASIYRTRAHFRNVGLAR